MASAGHSSFHLIDKENFFNNTHTLPFPHDFPYEFTSPYSTESESEDEDVAGITRRFSRSVSLKEPFYNFKEKQVFSGSPESTIGWSGWVSPPPFVKSEEDAWNRIYAAAVQVARMKMEMKMKMNITNGGVNFVANKDYIGLIGASRAFTNPHCTQWRRPDGENFFRQPQFCQNRGVYGNENCVRAGDGGCGGRSAPPPSFRQSVYPPPQLQNQRRRNQQNSGDGGVMAAKRECAGTGVFLPRSYCNNPPESRKGQATTVQSSNKTFPPPHLQARVNGGFIPNYETLMGRKDAAIVAAQPHRRSNIHGGVMVAPVNNPEMLLPQEWTY